MANIIENFMTLSNIKKVTYLLLVVAAIGVTVSLFQWAGQPEYQVLYSNLSQEDASRIVEKLREKRIKYRIEGMSSVMVPGEVIYETRLELAGDGLPSGGGVGFEIFDKTAFGISEFTQKINLLRATQGELARTIGWLSEVETARVHIVMPEKRLFLENEDMSRASVVLRLKPGRRLNHAQVQGIVHLVVGSVTGLNPQSVTVIDTNGQMLAGAMDDGNSSAALTSSQLEHQRSLERDIENRIRGILEPVVGVGKVVAKVSADIDFKQVEKTEERFDPDSVVIRSEQSTKEKSTGGTTIASGVPGVLSNLPEGAPVQETKSTPSQSQRQNEVINYEINKVVSRIVEPSGMVKRLSVAVLVDGSYEVSEGGEKGYIQRTGEEIRKFEDLVKGSIGFVAERGDKVEVVNIPFETQVPVYAGEGLPGPTLFKEYLPMFMRYGTIMVIAIILFLFVLRPLINGLFTTGAGTEMTFPDAFRSLEQGLAEQKAIAPSEEVRQKVVELAKQNPAQAAHIIKTWVKEK